jgi:hypothetical protein
VKYIKVYPTQPGVSGNIWRKWQLSGVLKDEQELARVGAEEYVAGAVM